MNSFLKPFVEKLENFSENPLRWVDSDGQQGSSCFLGLYGAVYESIQLCKWVDALWCLQPGNVVKKGKGHTHAFPVDSARKK